MRPPFHENDLIILPDGKICGVQKVGLRHSELYDMSNHALIFVPNNALSNATIANIPEPEAAIERVGISVVKIDRADRLIASEDRTAGGLDDAKEICRDVGVVGHNGGIPVQRDVPTAGAIEAPLRLADGRVRFFVRLARCDRAKRYENVR